jgi:hypothetical protein
LVRHMSVLRLAVAMLELLAGRDHGTCVLQSPDDKQQACRRRRLPRDGAGHNIG